MTAAPSTPDDVRKAVTALVKGSGFQITEDTSSTELTISNPGQPQRGHVFVSLQDVGHVCWEDFRLGALGRAHHFGFLEGIISGHGDQHTPGGLPVPGSMIIHLLTATD